MPLSAVGDDPYPRPIVPGQGDALHARIGPSTIVQRAIVLNNLPAIIGIPTILKGPRGGVQENNRQ